MLSYSNTCFVWVEYLYFVLPASLIDALMDSGKKPQSRRRNRADETYFMEEPLLQRVRNNRRDSSRSEVLSPRGPQAKRPSSGSSRSNTSSNNNADEISVVRNSERPAPRRDSGTPGSSHSHAAAISNVSSLSFEAGNEAACRFFGCTKAADKVICGALCADHCCDHVPDHPIIKSEKFARKENSSRHPNLRCQYSHCTSMKAKACRHFCPKHCCLKGHENWRKEVVRRAQWRNGS